MRRFLILIVFREMQIKIMIIYRVKHIRMTTIKEAVTDAVEHNGESRAFRHYWWKTKMM